MAVCCVWPPHDDGVRKGVGRLFVVQLRASGGASESVNAWDVVYARVS
jgi:hypothetical protein